MDPFLPKFDPNAQSVIVPFFFMHEGEECVRVQIAGETRFGPVFRAKDLWVRDGLEEITYAMRWPDQYAQFKDGKSQTADGTALEEAPFLNPSRISELRMLKIYSVEALANLDDRNIPKLGGKGYELKSLAQQYLQKRQETGANDKVVEMQRELAELRALLSAQVMQPVSNEGEYTRLREDIKAKTGKYPVGNPSLETLQRISSELNEAA